MQQVAYFFKFYGDFEDLIFLLLSGTQNAQHPTNLRINHIVFALNRSR